MSDSASSSLRLRAAINPTPLGVALLLIVLGAWYLAQTVGINQAALYVVGALLGITLYHAAFGFTSAWRVF
ncbi:MAG: YeeE/YedE family protein, partial [Janthinobacterium sp.]